MIQCERYLYVWCPSLFCDNGGIQIFSNFLIKAIDQISIFSEIDIFTKHDYSFDASSMNDQAVTHNLSGFGKVPIHLRSFVFSLYVGVQVLVHRPDLIISTHLNFGPLAHLLHRLFQRPYWLIAHGIDAWNIIDPGRCKALKQADRILTVSHYTRERLVKEQNLDPNKVLVLPNTFDHERFKLAVKPTNLLRKYCLRDDQPIILTAARLSKAEKYKGYDKILMALPEICKTIPNVHYILVGKGDDRSRVKTLVERLGLEEHVTFAGYVPDDELAAYYQLCDVFAMPSKGEGFGIVYLEALACGKPTLGGNQDGALDALCHGKLGALVNPDDIDAIARTLIQILQGTYPNTLMYQPELLRQKVIEIYGFEQFKHTLSRYLAESGQFEPV